ncbi:hypothetical protein AKO1_008444, partial [Acrasis kona]
MFLTKPKGYLSIPGVRMESKSQLIHEIIDLDYAAVGNEDNEWMYDMEMKNRKNAVNEYSSGFDHMMNGNFSEAINRFMEYITTNPNDQVAKDLIEYCRERQDGSEDILSPVKYEYKM